MAESLPSGLRLTALDPAFRADPYPILARLRSEEPIHHDVELGRYLFTRHADVYRILRNPNHWSDPRKANPGTFVREFLMRDPDEEPSMLLMDEPGHQRLRDLVRHPFTPRAVERWRARVRAVADRIVGRVEDGEFDLIADVANPIPTVVIAELLGIDPDLHPTFKAWSDDVIARGFSPVVDEATARRAEAAEAALDAFFLDEIEKRRKAPSNDLISSMIFAEENGDRLTETEIVSQCRLLLLAGNLTTTDLIGNGVKALLTHPDELAELRARPELMKNAVEEILRWDSPVIQSGRIAHEDLEFDGVKIAKGESLAVSLAAANRDPAVHADPDRFDIERADIHLLSFGGGRHFCLGAHLSRLEAAETLSALLERFPRLDFGSGGFDYAPNPGFRGMTRFSVEGGR